MAEKRSIPRINGTLRAHSLQIPECIWRASGIVVFGRRIKSVIFSTDVATIRNCNADAVLAVYPFTPQQIISKTLISASPIPVFAGVGGAITTGARSVVMAVDAEADGAFGVVMNAATKNDTIKVVTRSVDIPLIITIVNENADIAGRLEAGATILNVSAAAKTPEIVRKIRKDFPDVPIIATGGPTDETIIETIEAGANTISYTPPSTAVIFAKMMADYRDNLDPNSANGVTDDKIMEAIKYIL